MVERTQAEGRAYADAEEGAKSEEFSDARKLMDMISDACAKMDAVGERLDRMDARMDSLEDLKEEKKDARRDASEEEEKEEKADGRKDAAEDLEEHKASEFKSDARKDAAKKDAEEEPEEKGEPEETVADKKRKDAARKDAEDEEEKEERGDAYSDAALMIAEGTADLRRDIRALQARMPKVLSTEERERFAAIQEKADPAFQAFGDRAGPPLEGETPISYQQRLIGKLQKHSPKWAKGRITSIADADFLDSIATEVYADSVAAARRGAELPPGQLRAITKTSGAGHTIIEYEGDSPSAWMSAFAGNFHKSTGDFRTGR